MKTFLFLAMGLGLTTNAAEYDRLTTNGINMARSASYDGRYVAISTWSSLKMEDTNSLADVYVYDRLSKSIILASVGANGFTGYGSTGLPLISSNGNTVTFEHSASGQAGANDTRTQGNIYLRRISQGELEAIAPAAPGTPHLQSMSRDARFTFISLDTPGFYRRDNDLGINTLVSSSGGVFSISENGETAAFGVNAKTVVVDLVTGASNTVSSTPTLSGNGQVVVSRSVTSVVIRDLAIGSSISLPIATEAVSLSADGGMVAFDRRGFLGREPFASVAFLDRSTGTINPISTRAGTIEPGNGWSGSAVVSRDGRFIAFESWASDLVANDTNDTKDIFLYDIRARTLKQINAGGGPAMNPFFSDDSATLFFHNGKSGGGVDLYAMTLELDVLWIRAIEFDTSGTRRLFWISRPNARYQLEFKQSLDEPNWTPIGAEVSSAGTETSVTDPQADTARFYRVRTL
jgi:Tol biopolymer transport system component